MRTKTIIAASLVCALAHAHAARALDTIVTGLIGSANSGGWIFYIGMNKGYFADAGIAIDIVYVPTAPGLVQELAAGSLDLVTIGLVEPIHAVAKGAPVAILRLTSDVTAYEMLAQPSIKSVKDLKGKTICIGGLMDINKVYLDRIMKANGLTDSDYDITVIGNTAQRYAALRSGTVAATMLVPPTNFYAEKAGFTNIGMIEDYAKDIPMGGADVSLAWAKAHSDTAKRFVAAYDKSVEWFYDEKNRDEAIDMLQKLMKSNRDEIAQSYDYLRRIGYFARSDTVSRKRIENLIAAMRAIGDLQGVTVTPDQLVIPGLTKVVD
jgi:ABC-type nitrate/sulfonate/bicarbonate transport system substrate-binding protein